MVTRQAPKYLSSVLRVLVSTGLAAVVIWLASPRKLIESASLLNWPQLGLATGALVLALFVADSFCVYWLFSRPGQPLGYRSALAARGTSYLFSSFNYELGQAAMAWHLARLQTVTLLSVLALCLVLAYHDVIVLLSLGLFGASQSAAPQAAGVRWFCTVLLVAVLSLGILARFLPWNRLPLKMRVGLEQWTWSRSLQLGLLRTGYFSIFLFYAALGLGLSGITLSFQLICGVIPLVLLADGLPISASGLGTREATLLLLLNPDEQQRPVLVAFSLTWSLGLLLGRLMLGMGYWWFMPLETAKLRFPPQGEAQ
jgi:hypothetical protein